MSRFLGLVVTATSLAARSIWRRPVRALLTAFGILVGVAAVILVVALAEGAAVVVSSAIDLLGANSLMAQPRPSSRSGLRDDDRPSQLDESDAAALATDAPPIDRAAPMLTSLVQVVAGASNTSTTIVGTTSDFFSIRGWSPFRGEIWKPSAEAAHERVCIIGETVRSALFGPEDPVGRFVRIGRFPFRVTGLLPKKGQSPFGGDQDDVLVLPLSTMRSTIWRTRPGQVHRILFSTKSGDDVERAKAAASSLLRQRHGLFDAAPDDFEIRSQEDFRKTQKEVLGTLELLLLGVAGVSLLVGGIGVMNIMLVSVAERTREIGIRLSIGARAADIRAQFLIEAVVLTLFGGIAGAAAAAAGIFVLRDVLSLPLRLSSSAMAIAMATTSIVGVAFGFFPARRAAALDPIDALRVD